MTSEVYITGTSMDCVFVYYRFTLSVYLTGHDVKLTEPEIVATCASVARLTTVGERITVDPMLCLNSIH